MLVAKELRLGEIARERQLICPTLLRSALFAIVPAFFKVLEDAARGLLKGESVRDSIANSGGTWEGYSA